MFVVVEGPDLSGKSTLATKLSEKLNFTLVKWPYSKNILEKCPDESGETFLKTLLLFKDVNIVMDRGFISNLVYNELFDRNYDNSYLYQIAKIVKPHIIVLLPELETLIERAAIRDEKFINKDKFEELLNLYHKHTDALIKLGWNITKIEKISEYNKYVDNTKILNAAMSSIETRKYCQDVKDKLENANQVEIYSNHHKSFLYTKEILFNTIAQDIYGEKAVFDKDYEHIIPRLEEVINLLRKESTHRGAVILNPKAEQGDCICLWHFLIRENRLHTFVYIRSSDLDRKLIADVQITRWMIESIKSKIGVAIAPVNIVQGSAHMYI